MFLVGLLIVVVALSPVLVVAGAAFCALRLLWSLAMDAGAEPPAPPAHGGSAVRPIAVGVPA